MATVTALLEELHVAALDLLALTLASISLRSRSLLLLAASMDLMVVVVVVVSVVVVLLVAAAALLVTESGSKCF